MLFEVLLRDDAARYSAVWVARIGEFSERRAMTTTEKGGLRVVAEEDDAPVRDERKDCTMKCHPNTKTNTVTLAR